MKLANLNPQEVAECEAAKIAEVNNWIQTITLTKILRNQIPADQIFRCRWILTWKPIDSISPQNPAKTHRAKARLVVLGYLDPNIEERPRASPTLNRTARMIILQAIASHGWDLRSFDIKAAFLQGKQQADRLIAIEPVAELRKAMSMTGNEMGKLNRGAYGLIDAPYLWYCALVSELHNVGFEAAPFDAYVAASFVNLRPAPEQVNSQEYWECT